MAKNKIYSYLLAATVVSTFVVFGLIGMSTNANANSTISANDCAADMTCEANGIQVGTLIAGQVPPETANGVASRGAMWSQSYLGTNGPVYAGQYISVGNALAREAYGVYAQGPVSSASKLETTGYLKTGNPVSWKIPPEATNGGVISEGAIASQKYIKSYGPGYFNDYVNIGGELATKPYSLNAKGEVFSKEGVRTDGMVTAKKGIESYGGTGVVSTAGPIRMTDPSWYIASHGWMHALSFMLVGDVNFDGVGQGQLKVQSLQGTGNAYACVDSNGVLFRSMTPCVE
jgi:hypothetical protein